VETILLKASDGRLRCAGELAIGPIGPAIGNAFFALTGVRLHQLSMTPERVKSTLSGHVKGYERRAEELALVHSLPRLNVINSSQA
jgi:hypothetical protein